MDQPSGMRLVVGLGNPGDRYKDTRHNVGFLVVEGLAAGLHTIIRRPQYRALTATARFDRAEVLIMKPQTYMNCSGLSVAEACRDLSLGADAVVVVHDDVDLPLGRIRVRAAGGSGGHRGVASVIEELGTGEFPRVKVGIGRPAEGCGAADYVLETFTPEEGAVLGPAVDRAVAAVEEILNNGVRSAMNRYNGVEATGQ